MSFDPVDAAPSEPLLSSHQTQEDEDFDPLDNALSSKSRESNGIGRLFRSKYVVRCALFSSIGGLIFGYGTISINFR
jgi:hypothetical protein